MAALADGVVVVEAAVRSGALNTASWAADRAIPVMAFPGDVGRPKVAGCLALIRDGATLVRDAADVLAQLGLRGAGPGRARAGRRRRSARRRGSSPRSAAGPPAPMRSWPPATLPPALALARIGDLLAAGAIVSGPDGRFRRSPP